VGIRGALLLALGVVSVAFTGYWAKALAAEKGAWSWPSAKELGIGFLTDFLDTLGIGSFAVTTALFKLFKLSPDENIPGDLNVGHAIPTFAEAFIFMSIVEVDPKTLALTIAASVVGAWLGAGVVTKLPRRGIQLGMAVALLAAACFFVMKNLGWFPAGSDALGLSGGKLAFACAATFAFGALMTLGIGAYAPTMILCSLLGMNPTTAFPIMMGTCAFLMPTASLRFIKSGRYSRSPSLGLTLGGTPAVLVAAFIVKSLPLATMRWLVIVVVLYTAAMMLRSALSKTTKP
jgi:uncharacterized membrane protein YfcA